MGKTNNHAEETKKCISEHTQLWKEIIKAIKANKKVIELEKMAGIIESDDWLVPDIIY